MKKQKQNYVSPETETLVVRFEGGILTASNKVNVNGFVDDDDDLDAE